MDLNYKLAASVAAMPGTVEENALIFEENWYEWDNKDLKMSDIGIMQLVTGKHNQLLNYYRGAGFDGDEYKSHPGRSIQVKKLFEYNFSK